MEAERFLQNSSGAEGYQPDNVIPLRDFENQLSRRARLQKRLSEGEYVVNFKDKVSENKEVITVVGTAFAIGIAFGGLNELRKRRKK